jgi:hypothetical protein
MPAQLRVRGDDLRRLLQEKTRERVLEPRRVTHQVAHQDRAGEAAIRNPEIRRQIGVDRRIEAHAAGLDLLHHRYPGEGLGDRADSEERAIGIHRSPPAGEAIALVKHHLAVLDHADGDPGDMIALHGLAHDAIDQGFEFGGRDRLPRGQARRRRRGRGCGGHKERRQDGDDARSHGPSPGLPSLS